MKKIKTITAILFAVIISSTAFAADGSWTFDGDGIWTNNAMWAGGTVPNGAGDNAYFTNIYTDDKITAGIFNSQNITVGGIYLKNTRVQLPGPTVAGYELSTNITLDAGGGSPIIDVFTNRLDIQCGLDGTDGFTLQGDHASGVLMIGATPKSISGNVNLYDIKEIIVNNKDVFQNADVNVTGTTVRLRKDAFNTKSLTIGDGGMLNMTESDVPGSPTVLSSSSINANSGGKLRLSYPATLQGSNITVNAGGEFVIATVGTSTLENDMSIAGNGIFAALGAFHTEGGNVTNNGDVFFAADARYGQYGAGSNYFVQNGGFAGPGSVELLIQGGGATHARTFYLNGIDTRTGNTILSAFASQGTFEIGNHQQFPNTNLTLNVYHWTSDIGLTYNMNGYSQEVTSLSIIPGNISGNDTVYINGGSNGVLKTSESTTITGGKLKIKDGSLICQKYISFINNETFVSNSFIYCGLELMPGIGGAPGTVIFDNGSEANVFVTRVGIDPLTQSNNVGTIYLKSGSILKTAAVHNSGGENSGLGAGSALCYDGGILSDGLWGDWSGSLADWIRQGFSNVVQEGGAKIEVNNASGRIVNVPFLHDPALGGTEDGGLTKLGFATLTLSNVCSYTGPTIVKDGTLILNTLGKSKFLAVDEATIDDISGTLIIPSGTTVSPGSSIGTIYVQSNLVMQSGSIYKWEVGASYLADLISIDGELDISGAAANSITVNVTTISDVLSDETNILFTAASINGNADAIFMTYAIGNSGPEHPFINGNTIEIADIIIPEPGIISILCLLAFAYISRKK
jgi:autotransporter-associated beta strand protein